MTLLTPTQARNSALFEAHLRGGEVAVRQRYNGPMSGIEYVGEWHYPLDPTTDTGAWEAMELMAEHQIIFTRWNFEHTQRIRAAVLAAWLAAVEQWVENEQADGSV